MARKKRNVDGGVLKKSRNTIWRERPRINQ